ncbi:MAG: Cof-type HAD-IIB family hydrolase [Mycoplasma sp.]|nr:Cof-type HAD-IIB family hydrolase [Mycoplasma sp.]
MKFKAYFIDLDGTLYDGKKKISDDNMKSIIEKNKTSPVVISTGRPKIFVDKLFNNKYPFQFLIAQNGAIIWEKNKIIEKNEINNKIGNEIIEFLLMNNMGIKINDELDVYTKNWLSKIWISKFTDFNSAKYSQMGKYKSITKIVVFSFSRKKTKNIKDYLMKKYPKKLKCIIVNNRFGMEITHINATKGNAALKVLKKLKIKPEFAVHIGDSNNDFDAAEKLGYSIAMKKSSKTLLSKATHIGPSYKKSGISKILNDNKYEENNLKQKS